jgi:glycosyltransferase involved in cell wall biosynthesis
MGNSTRSVKQILRPLVPDYVMNRIRLRRNSKAARWNIDVAVEDTSMRRRWLRFSPDTYRVMSPQILGNAPPNLIVLPQDEPASEASRMLSRSDLGAAVVGEVQPLHRSDRTLGPTFAPTTIVLRTEVLEDIGGIPDGPVSLPGVLARLLDAGHHIGLIPKPAAGADATRRDPISGETVVVFAAVPLHDVGGGSRGAQITFELLRRGYHVTYVNSYPSYEDVDLGLRFLHPRLEQLRFEEFDARVLSERCGQSTGLAIVEVPEPVYGAAIEDLQASGWHIVYDVIDDWSDPSLGGEWYDETFEADLTVRADTVVASAPDLVTRVADTGRADATLVPNAVNESVFGLRPRERPDDLPDGPLLGYHGSLYGDWFDWEALGAIARANSDASIVVIGEARGVPSNLPANIVFLGLKSQSDLPAYVQFFDVGLVPFKVTRTTHAVSPLKVYEYLACGVPVAAPPLRALAGIEGITVDTDLVAAVVAARSGPRPDAETALREHSWSARLTTMYRATDRVLADTVGPTVRVEHRPPVHYRWRERRITN